MAKLLSRLFNLFPGEEKSASLLALLGFLWAVAVTSGLKFADALFLLHIGSASLPVAYSISAGCMILIAAGLIYAFHTFSTHRIFIFALSCGVIFYLFSFSCFYFRIGLNEDWLWYALRVFGSIFFSVIVTCFWTFVDQYFHLQDAKRLFSLFSSMIFLGVATTGSIMLLGLIEFQQLSLLIAATLTATIFLIIHIHKTLKPVHDDSNIELDSVSYEESIKSFLKGVLSSKFTLLLMCMNFLIYISLVTTEFNYFASFDRHFHTTVNVGDEADAKLTLFLGKALACVSITNLIFGLFFFSRLLRKFGIGMLLPITPIILLITYIGWNLDDALIFALMGYFVVEGTLYVIDDSNFNLLLNGVPARMKHKIRVSIESFFEPVGTLVSAGLLSLSWLNPKLLGLLLSILLLIVALLLRKSYVKAIYLNLTVNLIHFQRTVLDWFHTFSKKEKKGIESRLLAILRQKDSGSKNFALQALIQIEDRTILKKVIHEVELSDVHEKEEFIRLLEDSPMKGDILIVEAAQRWLMEYQNPSLQSELMWYLAKIGLTHPDKVIDELDNPQLKIQGSAILTLKSSHADLDPDEAWQYKTKAYQKIKELLESQDTDKMVMALKILASDASQHDLEIVLTYLQHPYAAVQLEAAKTISQISLKNPGKTLPRLMHALSRADLSETRLLILKSLKRIIDSAHIEPLILQSTHFRPIEKRMVEEVVVSQGLKNVPLLLTLVKERSFHEKARLLAGKALGKLAVYQLRANLAGILKHEIDRAFFYLYHYHTVDNSLLKDALKTGYYSVLDFIIQLLGTAGEIEDCELLSRSMRSQNLKIRSQVVETLEKSCEPQIFREIVPLIEESPPEFKISYYLKRGGKPLILKDLLCKMVESSSVADRIAAFTLLQTENHTGWQALLKKHMLGSEEIFQHFAYELLET